MCILNRATEITTKKKRDDFDRKMLNELTADGFLFRVSKQ